MQSTAFLPSLSVTQIVSSWRRENAPSGNCPTPRVPMSRRPCHMSVVSQSASKATLLEMIKPLDFGRAVADNAVEQEKIEAVVQQLEAANPSPTPGADPNLTGVWNMVYTTSESILNLDKPAFLRSSNIVQELNGENLTGRNAETYKLGPLEIENAVEAKLIPTAPNRFDVNFVRFVIAGLIRIDVEKNDRFMGWLEVTYLDEDLRISRGNKGNLFVLVKK